MLQQAEFHLDIVQIGQARPHRGEPIEQVTDPAHRLRIEHLAEGEQGALQRIASFLQLFQQGGQGSHRFLDRVRVEQSGQPHHAGLERPRRPFHGADQYRDGAVKFVQSAREGDLDLRGVGDPFQD